MPTGVTFYKKEMDQFVLKMTTKLGFTRMQDWQTIAMIRESLSPFEMQTQQGKSGVETCLMWRSSVYKFLAVYVWTSYVASEGSTRQNDLGWVCIYDHRPEVNRVIYFRFPRRRTKNFLKRMEDDAFICKELIDKYWASNCNICDTVMTLELVRGSVFHEVHFVCPLGDRTRTDDICQKIPENKEGKRLRKLLLEDIERYDKMVKRNSEKEIFVEPARVKRFFSKKQKKETQQGEHIHIPYTDGEYHFHPDE